jgi:hypothetical protein
VAEIPKNGIKVYPDITEILKRKEERRKELARKPIEEKLAVATRLKNAAKVIKNSEKVNSK